MGEDKFQRGLKVRVSQPLEKKKNRRPVDHRNRTTDRIIARPKSYPRRGEIIYGILRSIYIAVFKIVFTWNTRL